MLNVNPNPSILNFQIININTNIVHHADSNRREPVKRHNQSLKHKHRTLQWFWRCKDPALIAISKAGRFYCNTCTINTILNQTTQSLNPKVWQSSLWRTISIQHVPRIIHIERIWQFVQAWIRYVLNKVWLLQRSSDNLNQTSNYTDFS